MTAMRPTVGSPRSYVNPVPGGTVGRTDMGVDISGPPGTRVLAIAREKLIGILPNWYRGQPLLNFEILNSQGRPTGRFDYVAEQIHSRLRIGQTVQAGQEIGTIAPSGTGLELGWSTRSGATLAQATTGYTEGQQTAAGQSYRSQVIQGGTRAPVRSNQRVSLAQLWIDAGGSPHLANIMAAIAMAESSGRINATNKNSNGTIDRGLWQINSSHSQFNAQRLLTDPLYNAKAAVAIEKSQGLGAWTTYNTGAYRKYLGAKTPAYTVAQRAARTRPGGQPANDNSQAISQVLQDYTSLRDTPRTAPPGTKNPFHWWWASFTGNWDQLGGAGG